MSAKTSPRPSSNLTKSYILRASHLLLPTAPSLSTTLLSTSPAAQSSPGISNVCKSCGAILIPGWNAHVRTLPRGKEKRKEATVSKTTVVWECQSCGDENRSEVGKPRVKRKRREAGGVGKVEVGGGAGKKVDRGGNQGSKARAKKRKGGSLADALAKQRKGGGRGGGVGGFGLDLMDLMKMG